MATTTPNYGWPVPTSTDYVKDGATAIEALGDAIDATVFGLGSSALTLINTTTFSAVASQSVNTVFSSTYQNYVVQINLDSVSATGYQQLRMRVAGADDSTSNYFWSGIYNSSSGTTPTGEGGGTATSFTYGYMESTATGTATFDFANPFATKKTTYTNLFSRATGVGNSLFYTNGGAFNATTSFTGFTIFPASGNITGTIRVYGVKN